MATTLVEIAGPPQLALSVQLYAVGSDTVLATAGCSERSHNLGCYTFSLVDVASGLYRVRQFLTATNQTVGQYALRHAHGSAWEFCHEFTDPTPGGSGAYAIALTVVNGASQPVASARVRVSRPGETFLGVTDAAGQVGFSLDAANWTVSITASGFAFAPATLSVNANTTSTYVLTDNQPAPPGSPLLAAGYLDCFDTAGMLQAGVKITVQQCFGDGTPGYGYTGAEFLLTSDAQGRMQHGGFVRRATYRARRGEIGRWSEFTVPDAPTFPLPEILGAP